jgi:hypothetical protein
VAEYCEHNDTLIKQLQKNIENNKKQAQQFITGIVKAQVQVEDILSFSSKEEAVWNEHDEHTFTNELIANPIEYSLSATAAVSTDSLLSEEISVVKPRKPRVAKPVSCVSSAEEVQVIKPRKPRVAKTSNAL